MTEQTEQESLQAARELITTLTELGWTFNTLAAYILYSSRFLTAKEHWGAIDEYVTKRLADYPPQKTGSPETDQAMVFALFQLMMTQINEMDDGGVEFLNQLQGLRSLGAQILAADDAFDELSRVMLALDQQHIFTKLFGGYNDLIRSLLVQQRSLLGVAHHFEDEPLL